MNYALWNTVLRVFMYSDSQVKGPEKVDYINLYVQVFRAISIEMQVFFKSNTTFEITHIIVNFIDKDGGAKYWRDIKPEHVGGYQNLAIVSIMLIMEVAVRTPAGYPDMLLETITGVFGNLENGFNVSDMATDGSSWLKLFNRRTKKMFVFDMSKQSYDTSLLKTNTMVKFEYEPDIYRYAMFTLRTNSIGSYKKSGFVNLYGTMDNPAWYLERFYGPANEVLNHVEKRYIDETADTSLF